jgi:hypothetical protein
VFRTLFLTPRILHVYHPLSIRKILKKGKKNIVTPLFLRSTAGCLFGGYRATLPLARRCLPQPCSSVVLRRPRWHQYVAGVKGLVSRGTIDELSLEIIVNARGAVHATRRSHHAQLQLYVRSQTIHETMIDYKIISISKTSSMLDLKQFMRPR